MTTIPVVQSAKGLFTPIKGCKASAKLADGGYFDVTVQSLNVRTGMARIVDEDGIEYDIRTSKLERPLLANVNERFEYFRQLTDLTMDGKLYSLIASGEGGIGKSHMIGEMLELKDLKEETHFLHIKGFSTAKALYNLLKDHSEKLVIFDDCDNILTDPIGQNILKAVLDTSKSRRVRWLTNLEESSFVFTGSAIFLTNKNKDKIPQALISRSLVVDLYMTPEEKIERMRYLVPTLDAGATLTVEEKNAVLDVIDKYKDTIHDLNVRTVVKALLVYENTKDIDIVRYQVLQ